MNDLFKYAQRPVPQISDDHEDRADQDRTLSGLRLQIHGARIVRRQRNLVQVDGGARFGCAERSKADLND
jgi:hypothetical protein